METDPPTGCENAPRSAPRESSVPETDGGGPFLDRQSGSPVARVRRLLQRGESPHLDRRCARLAGRSSIGLHPTPRSSLCRALAASTIDTAGEMRLDQSRGDRWSDTRSIRMNIDIRTDLSQADGVSKSLAERDGRAILGNRAPRATRSRGRARRGTPEAPAPEVRRVLQHRACPFGH